MPTSFNFNNRNITLPGAYSVIKSGENNPARNLDYGTCLIIDTGVFGANWGGGAGVDGQLSQGQDSIYSFDNISDFRSFVKGGMYYKLADALFTPDPANPAAIGISNLLFVRAAKTTCAKMTFATSAGGSFIIDTIDEGTVANGVLTEGNLVTGYGAQAFPGIEDPTKWILKFYRGTFTGLADDGIPYNEIPATAADPVLVLQSPEFSTITELINWAKTSSDFNQVFKLDAASAATGEGKITEEDVTAWIKAPATYVIATGGTATYSADNFQSVLDQIVGLDYSFVFIDQYGANANSTLTQAYIKHMNMDAKFQHFLFVGGYGKQSEFTQSVALAQGFNSPNIQLVHGDVQLTSDVAGSRYRNWTVMYNLCCLLGRTAGKAPYIPVTNKTIGVDKVVHVLSDSEKAKALKSGVLVTVYNPYTRQFVCLQGVNTLQDNQNLFNAKGQSFSIQFMRIVAQVNKELMVNAEIDLLGQENGVNVNTLSAGAVKDWTVAYLQSRTATNEEDNLLLAFQDVVVTRKEDAWFVTYKIRVNNEINKLFFTGFLIR